MTAPAELSSIPVSESGLADYLIRCHGRDMRFCPAWNKWLTWNGSLWTPNLDDVQSRLKSTFRTLQADATTKQNYRMANLLVLLEKRSARNNIIALAQHDATVRVTPEQFDEDPMALNCLNGTLDLRTRKLSPPARRDLLTRTVATTWQQDSKCPLWFAFLDRIFDGDLDLISYVSRCVGYSLTARVSEQTIFILFGNGANGKSTLLLTLAHLMNSYSHSADIGLLLPRAKEQRSNENAQLFKSRMVVLQETPEGQKLSESKVKLLTGGDRIVAQRPREEVWNFAPTHKLWVATNYLPEIHGTDHAIWRRIRPIPFSMTIPEDEQDKNLPEKLLGELPGILRWAVEGCADWQRVGLKQPAKILAGKEAYRRRQDSVARFIDERCITDAKQLVFARDLYGAFLEWAKANEKIVIAQRALGQRLGQHGFTPGRLGPNGDSPWKGIGLNPVGQPETTETTEATEATAERVNDFGTGRV